MPSIGLNIGLKSLLAARAALETVGHNIANANTPGYSRQSLLVSASPALLLRGLAIGNGVDADSILRTADALLQRRLVTQTSVMQALDARLSRMGHVESLLGEQGDQGLNALMQGFFSSFSTLAASPDDRILRNGAVQSSLSLADRFKELANGLQDAKTQSALDVGAQTEEVNQLTSEIAKLNREIGRVEGGGIAANDLRDQREQALAQLGALVDVAYTELDSGAITVQTGGALLVGANKSYAMSSTVASDGTVTLRVQGSPNPIHVKGGAIGGLVQVSQSFVPSLAEKLDALAHQFILEMNRAHSTGIPKDGGFEAMTSSFAVADTDHDGALADELLSRAGLPFDVKSGKLVVTVSSASPTDFTTHEIAIDPDATTVGEFVDALDAIPDLRAELDSTGRLRITADPGFRFDFGRRLDTRPDRFGAFGGGRASLGASTAGPYNLSDGDTLDLTGPGGSTTVSFDATDFANIGQATAEEVAAAINADPAVQSIGLRACTVCDRVVIQSIAEGSGESLTVDGGTSLGALGWSAGTTTSGQDDTVDVKISGDYEGAENERFLFVPSQDGTIGTTPGLTIDVFDTAGDRVATLNVGEGYTPGTKLALADGLEVSFGLGAISATDFDSLELRAVADSDTSDVLVALGMNSLFTGVGASDIAVRADIANDPDLLSGSANGARGDNGVFLDLVGRGERAVAGLDGDTFGESYSAFVADVGFEIDTARDVREVDQYLFDSLTARREQVAGVNVDEELVNMVQFEQAFGAAAQYIQVIQSTHDELMRMI